MSSELLYTESRKEVEGLRDVAVDLKERHAECEKRLAEMREEHDIWEKHSLVQIVEERDNLRGLYHCLKEENEELKETTRHLQTGREVLRGLLDETRVVLTETRERMVKAEREAEVLSRDWLDKDAECKYLALMLRSCEDKRKTLAETEGEIKRLQDHLASTARILKETARSRNEWEAAWQEERAERIRLEERLKFLQARYDSARGYFDVVADTEGM